MTMKAFELQGFGGLDDLAWVDRPIPEPGHGEVLIRMKAASLNYRDLITVSGGYGQSVKTPLVPLSDGCGEVVGVGEGVLSLVPGDRVATLFFQNWMDGPPSFAGIASALGGFFDGVAQEYMVLKEQGVLKVPDTLSDAQVACLPCAGLTAWRALQVEGRLKPGETVLLLGTGGVSIFGLQFAKANGAEVIITSSSDEKLAKTRALGADHTINYKDVPQWSKVVRDLTGFMGVDHILEVGGAGTLKESMKSLKIGGHISLIGVLAEGGNDFRLGAAVAMNAKLQAISVGSRASFEDMLRAMTLHKIEPVVDKSFAFKDMIEALEYMRSGGHFGKICLEF
jgi:NADPH:quinone reductase-like Zn-dependent oxidoreductase